MHQDFGPTYPTPWTNVCSSRKISTKHQRHEGEREERGGEGVGLMVCVFFSLDT